MAGGSNFGSAYCLIRSRPRYVFKSLSLLNFIYLLLKFQNVNRTEGDGILQTESEDVGSGGTDIWCITEAGHGAMLKSFSSYCIQFVFSFTVIYVAEVIECPNIVLQRPTRGAQECCSKQNKYKH